jgi:hypothetical protein
MVHAQYRMVYKDDPGMEFGNCILGLQRRFLPMLTHRHAAMDFDAVRQGNGTVQELYNLMIKLAERMVHLPDEYTI